MTRRCIFPKCPTNSLSLSARKGLLHSFPSKTKTEKRKLWIVNCSEHTQKINVDHHAVCNLHFKDNDFDLLPNGVKKLKSCAVPLAATQTVTCPNTSTPVPTASSSWTGENNVLDDGNFQQATDGEKENQIPATSQTISPTPNCSQDKDEEITRLRLEVFQARMKIEDLEAQLTKSKSVQGSQSKLIQRMQKMIDGLRTTTRRILSRFTPGQKTLLLNPDKKFVHWNDEDMSNAIGLYSKSPPGYEHTRSEMHIPLPSTSCVQKHLSKFNVGPDEVFPYVLALIKQKFQNAPRFLAKCVISVDEMGTDSKYCYDPKLDQIFGGKKNVALYCVRGLFEDWKEPLYFTYEQSVSQLTYLIRVLHENGLDVVACASDMGPKNQKIWKDLGIGQVENGKVLSSSFEHPVTREKIWWFPDYPHLLKSLRNNFLDNGITLSDGTFVDKTWIQDLIKLQKDELNITFKLGNKHLYLRDKQRQNVRTAFEVFSHSTATAIRLCLSRRENSQECANFFDLVDTLSDVCNSHIAHDHYNPYQCAYGMHHDIQSSLIRKAEEVFAGFTVGSRKKGKLAPFQKGFLMYMKSLQELYEDMKKKFDCFRFIRTIKLNQDYLESMFSAIRSYGGFNYNPTPTDFKYRIRKLAFNWNAKELKDGSLLKCNVASTAPEFEHESPEFARHVEESLQRIDTAIDETVVYDLEYLDPDQICREGGREYVAGYIAKKLTRSHPELSIRGTNEDSRNFYVSSLSRGGLTEPSTKWFAIFVKFEQVFEAIHPKNTANQDKGIVRKLEERLSEMFFMLQLPPKVIKFYSRIRTFIRIRTLNKQIEDLKFAKQEMWKSSKKTGPSGEQSNQFEPVLLEPETDMNGEGELSNEGETLVSQFVDSFIRNMSSITA